MLKVTGKGFMRAIGEHSFVEVLLVFGTSVLGFIYIANILFQFVTGLFAHYFFHTKDFNVNIISSLSQTTRVKVKVIFFPH